MRLTKALKELTPIAAAYGLQFAGTTSKGHFKWLHPPTGRTYVSVSAITSFHSLKNTERQIRRFVREVTDGQHDRPH